MKAAVRVGIPENSKNILATRWQKSPEVAAELLLHRLYLVPIIPNSKSILFPPEIHFDKSNLYTSKRESFNKHAQ